jgi:hypothetical protein
MADPYVFISYHSLTAWMRCTLYCNWFKCRVTGRKVAEFVSRKVVGFVNLRNPSSRNMGLGSTQPLTEMSTRNLPGDEERPVLKAHDLTAICESIVQKLWYPRHLITMWFSMACYVDIFTFSYMDQSLSSGANSFPDNQEFTHHLRLLKVHYSIHNS